MILGRRSIDPVALLTINRGVDAIVYWEQVSRVELEERKTSV